MTPADWLARAQRALTSAELLLARGDTEGACNRAYYAMHDAARAALCHATPNEDLPRSHGGLIAAFSERWVKTGRSPVELGRAFNRAADLRLLADYGGTPIDTEAAAAAAVGARAFVVAVAGELAARPGDAG